MSTRVTSAIGSRRARENLVRLLFRSNDRPAAAAAVASDPVDRRRQQQQRHSYARLRAAYIERVHEMHPDKMAADDRLDGGGRESREERNSKFVELKNAWEEYHASVRVVRELVGLGGIDDDGENDIREYEGGANFTMFGVGCSFADSPEERDRRNEITEQACRGWFPSGSIPPRDAVEGGDSRDDGGLLDASTSATTSGDEYHPIRDPFVRPRVDLIDENMFVGDESTNEDDSLTKRTSSSLVQNADKFRRKRLYNSVK
jgi:hypothetical protein